MSDPGIFFIWRNVMIIWPALMYNGIARIMTENKKLQIIPTLMILIIGYALFIWGLFILGDIQFMMYIFLGCLYLPVCLLVCHLFWLFGTSTATVGPKITGLGFFIIFIAYLLWPAIHKTINYYISYAVYV